MIVRTLRNGADGTIGDAILANKISEIGKSVEREEFKNEINRTVKQHFSQLKTFLAS
ncbi:MAG: hypothetical protein ABIH76_00950 [Candidatus Bathyarchaeota archaeon]